MQFITSTMMLVFFSSITFGRWNWILICPNNISACAYSKLVPYVLCQTFDCYLCIMPELSWHKMQSFLNQHLVHFQSISVTSWLTVNTSTCWAVAGLTCADWLRRMSIMWHKRYTRLSPPSRMTQNYRNRKLWYNQYSLPLFRAFSSRGWRSHLDVWCAVVQRGMECLYLLFCS